MEFVINGSRCVSHPDCDGLWLELVFEPCDYHTNGLHAEPARYMVRRSEVYNIFGDWAVCLSGRWSDSTLVKPKKEIGAAEWGQTSRWININVTAIDAIQKTFFIQPTDEFYQEPD